jgi:FkbM family methyltransferase
LPPIKFSQSFLKQIGLYQRLKASSVYDLYWTIADRRLLADREAEVAFYLSLLKGFKAGAVIFDIGANEGAKTDIFLRMGAHVIAVDPDESNTTVLRQRFQGYRFRQRPVVIVPKAVSDHEAIETMWIDAPGSAKNTLSRKWVDVLRADHDRFGTSLEFAETRQVATVTLEQLMRKYGVPHFVKIDVEGAEPLVLRGLQQPVPYLSFEVNLPEFRPEGLECISLLSGIASEGRFNYTADCLVGLALTEWLPATEFSSVLEKCQEPSVEVFWRTSHSPKVAGQRF